MDNLILEISHLGLNGSFDLLVGDFNARSQIWGYGFEDRREQIISEFIATNNFSICKRTDLGPTFITDKAQSFPDLSLLPTALQDLFDSWWILNKESLSDHKYICVQLAGDFQFSDDFIFKTKHSSKKFLKIFKRNFDKLNLLSNSMSSAEDSDYFYKILLHTVGEVAYSAFKKKPVHNKKLFKFWNNDLRKTGTELRLCTASFQALKRLEHVKLRSGPRALPTGLKGPKLRD
ncbi:hypothetical protein AVEN_78205-1 [Araneus ventricosus]|uniref:Endonuclease/exonuclease/phosphatase domain-containing protein n=1 Tax=Araneus ventricosus TaxID=182803 RepID=A0A4Y2R638_ARAVE|nr:hypothetical protein AVEN_78205-1 [Araneus ventricosus]